MKVFAIIFLSCLFSHVNAEEYDSYKLRWSPPNSYVNGEYLSVKQDLRSYRIYYGPTREKIRENSVTINPLLTKFSLSDLDKFVVNKSDIIYLAITAIDKSGGESELSEITFFLP
jgi:hypothetical protein